MKIICLTCAFLVLFVSNVFAIASIDVETIKEAQSYGMVKAHQPLKDFLLPWVSYEEESVKLNNAAEHAYLYTTFLLMATDAREKTLNGNKVSLLDSERILTDYTDIVSLSIVLYGEKEDFAKNARVALKQDEKNINPYQIVIPSSSEKIINSNGTSLFKVQCYAYFLERDIELESPVTLLITTSNQEKHSFYYDLKKIK